MGHGLQQEITRGVVTELVSGVPAPDRQVHRVGRADCADVCLCSLSCRLLSDDETCARLARFADGLTHVDGAMHFACPLSLAREPEVVMWRWQFAAGAGNATAAYCLYLLHLSRGESRDSEHRMRQGLAPTTGSNSSLRLSGRHAHCPCHALRSSGRSCSAWSRPPP